jgi:L-lactate utilization protein LutB
MFVGSGQEARDYVVTLAKEKGARSIIKSKEHDLRRNSPQRGLRQAGYEVVESDLGEYIVQLREEAPYHLVFPAMLPHSTKGTCKQRSIGLLDGFDEAIHETMAFDRSKSLYLCDPARCC